MFLLLIISMNHLQANPDITFLGPYGGDVRSLAIHPDKPDRVILGTADGQIFISLDRGQTWKRSAGIKRRQLVLDSIVFHPRNPDIIYAGGWELKRDRGQLYRSMDGGDSWDLISLGREFNSSVRAVAISPVDPDLIAVGITEGVLLSKDGGDSWDRISRGFRSMHNVHSLAFDPLERESLFVGTFRLGWRTDNLGGKWSPLTTGIFWDSDFFSIQINPAERNNVIIGACSGFYRSTDRGEKWNKIKNGLTDEAKRTRVVSFDPSDPKNVYAGTTAGLYKSTNNGLAWKPILKNVIINSIIVHPADSNLLLVGTDDTGVMISCDGGATFSPSNNGFSHRQISAIAQKKDNSTNTVYIAVAMDREYGGFFHSEDRGNTWTQFNDGLGSAAPWISAILPSYNSDKVFVATKEGVYSGTPGASSWILHKSTGKLKINQLAYTDTTETSLLIASDEGLFRLDPESDKISRLKTGIYDDGITSVITVGDKSFAGTKMGVFSSLDQGKTWAIDVEGLPYVRVNSFSSTGGYLFCATAEGIFKLDLNGSTWEPGNLNHDQSLSIASAGSRSSLFTADLTNGYFFYSRDQGLSWNTYDLGQVISHISCLSAESDNQILAGTVSEGLVRIHMPEAE